MSCWIVLSVLIVLNVSTFIFQLTFFLFINHIVLVADSFIYTHITKCKALVWRKGKEKCLMNRGNIWEKNEGLSLGAHLRLQLSRDYMWFLFLVKDVTCKEWLPCVCRYHIFSVYLKNEIWNYFS